LDRRHDNQRRQDAAPIYRDTADRHSEGMVLEGLGLALLT
jgi:hypothetical protein